MEKRTAWIKVDEIPLKIDMGMVVEAIIFDKNQDIQILNMSEGRGKLRAGQSFIMTILATPEI